MATRCAFFYLDLSLSPAIFHVSTSHALHQSIDSFYDAIAADYDQKMTAADGLWRDRMRDAFVQHVPFGKVLDFGGGTGLDMAWMAQQQYNIFFLEPSPRMRAIAKARAPISAKFRFIEENTDFTRWHKDLLPFETKMQGVIANFAVLNCIQHPGMFFEKVAMVMESGGFLAAMVLDPAFRSMWKMHSPLAACRILFQSKVTILNQYKGVHHPTYIHSRKALVSSSAKYSELRSYSPLRSSGFAILLLQKRP